ncbi:MAG: ComEC/Rec2 family competence protein [Oscillospiraceae bacterium]|nr:ComEC/Rec2 family competence protein [Oscillospiraceae bacterium]
MGLSYILGLTIACMVPWQQGAAAVGLAGAAALTAAGLRRRQYLLLSTLSVLIACCVCWGTQHFYADPLKERAGTQMTVTGYVTRIRSYTGGYASLEITGTDENGVPVRVQVTGPDEGLAYDEGVRVTGIPSVPQRTYLFDSSADAASRMIFLRFDSTAHLTRTGHSLPGVRRTVQNWRSSMCKRMRLRMDENTAAFLTGMLFGDKSGLAQGDRDALYRAGIGHVLAVSGLHLDFLALLVSFVLRRLRAGRYTVFGVSTALCLVFMLCTGLSVSVARAAIMLLLSQSARLFFRRSDPFNSLGVAMLVLGLVCPFAVCSAAFWLSCSGAFGIGTAARVLTQRMETATLRGRALQYCASLCTVSLCVLPASALYFREISLISPLSNLLFVPVCMAAMLLGLAALFFGCYGPVGEALLHGAQLLCRGVLKGTGLVTAVPGTHMGVDGRLLPGLLLLGAAFGVLVWALWRDPRLTGYAMGFAVCLCFAVCGVERMLRPPSLRVAVLGGDYDCVLAVCSGQDAVLVDLTGYAPGVSYADAYLAQQSVRQLDGIVLYRPREAGLAQYAALLEDLPPAHVWSMQSPPRETLLGVPVEEVGTLTLGEGAVRLAAAPDGVHILCGACDVFCTKQTLQLSGTQTLSLSETGNGLELTLRENGTCRVRRIYGDT